MPRQLGLYLGVLLLSAQLLCAEPTTIQCPLCAADESHAHQIDTAKQSRRLRFSGGVLTAAGGAIAIGGTALSVIWLAVDYPPPPVLLFMGGAVGGVFLAREGVQRVQQGRAMQLTTGVKSLEFRLSLQLQGYGEPQLYDKKHVFLGNPNHAKGSSVSHPNGIEGDREQPPLPAFAAEMGVLLPSKIFVGIYGQVLYAGAMAVLCYEWEPTEQLAFSAGIKAGYLRECWTSHARFPEISNHHEQFGGPQCRISIGGSRLRVAAQLQLWVDRVAHYVFDDYSTVHYKELKGYAPLSTMVGVSPAASFLVQWRLPF